MPKGRKVFNVQTKEGVAHFKLKRLAMNYGIERLLEHWIVHVREVRKNDKLDYYEIKWWCQ